MSVVDRRFIQDVTLRDGMHAVRHRIGPTAVVAIVQALDAAGVDGIEIAHGDGLAGSPNYGPGSNTDWEWIEAAAEHCTNARLTSLLLPGIGTIEELTQAHSLGVRSVRIATHCTEADVSAQHIATARDLGMAVRLQVARGAGQAHGVLRRPLRLRHRLGRPADDGWCPRPDPGPTATPSPWTRRSASTPTRTSRSQSPKA